MRKIIAFGVPIIFHHQRLNPTEFAPIGRKHAAIVYWVFEWNGTLNVQLTLVQISNRPVLPVPDNKTRTARRKLNPNVSRVLHLAEQNRSLIRQQPRREKQRERQSDKHSK